MPATRLLSAMVATWNNVATAFTGLKLNVTDTASASGSLLMDLQVGGASQFSVSKTGAVQAASNLFATSLVGTNSNTGMLFLGTTADVQLRRDAANTLALRNGTSAQKLSVYNTYTDASNYERGVFDWAGTANTLRIGTEAAGTGTVRNIQLVAGSNSVTATVGASNLLTLNGGLTLGGNYFTMPSTGTVSFGARGSYSATADGVFRLANNAATSTTDITLSGASGAGASTATFGGNLAAPNLFSIGSVYTATNTVATLPPAVGQTGARRFVTDANATMAAGVGTAVVGGGANKVPVYSDGTNWLIG